MNWESFRSKAAEKTAESFREQEQREQELDAPIFSIERENLMENQDGSIPSSDIYQQVFSRMTSTLPGDAAEEKYDARNRDGQPVGVEFHSHPEAPWDSSVVKGVNPVIDADLWAQLEIASSPQAGIGDATEEVNGLYEFAKKSMPEELNLSGSALSDSMKHGDRRKGLAFEDSNRDYDAINEHMDEVTQKGRYWDYIKALGPAVLLNGLGTSIQVSGQPRKEEETWSENTQRYLLGTENEPGNLALKPLQRLPGANSPYMPDGELATPMARLQGWRETTGNSPVLGDDGPERHGYPEQLVEMLEYGSGGGFFEDQVEFRGTQPMVFTSPVDADNLEAVEGGGEWLQDGEYNVTVTDPDRDYAKTLRDFVEDQHLYGIVTFRDDEGDLDEVYVEADFTDLEPEEFMEQRGWQDYLFHEGTVWTHDRLRAGVGVFEDRPEGNLPQDEFNGVPEWEMSAYNQAAWKIEWPELQQKAAEIGITESDATELEQEVYEQGHDHELAQRFYDEETIKLLGQGAIEAGAPRDKARVYMDWLNEGIHGEGPPAERNHKTAQYVSGDRR